ncbi:DUF6242 domain-containing protein [Dysgonomonas sp. 25]|uniref:DUF6242 domain-containing protein n=1 Tax=Dysgonomonas sp. 25 TaxID=2302933 RepID=UPI0013D6E1AD|nr:DUF6242 domain-containing protein [Dysgonomonas sp. 25]NDV68654.1 hypothetical protein [Dysgonomonas sp. 25]
MNLKHIAYTVITILISVLAYSCNDSETDTTYSYSNNSMIYSFSLKGTPYTGHDTAAYAVLEKTVFAIDQRNNLIYNPDSLPYKTRLTKFMPTISFESGSTAKVEVIEPDSTWTWSSSDSINFANNIDLLVTPPSGEMPRRYGIKLNIHQIDPDTIAWKQVLPSLANPAGSKIKALVNDDDLFVYIKTASAITVYTSNKNTISWTSTAAVGLPPATTKLESLILFNNTLYILDDAGLAYSSPVTDGVNWTSTGNATPIYSILGILPEPTAATDSLLVLYANGANYSFAKSIDMAALNPVAKIKGFAANVAPQNFPSTGFSTSTNYARDDASQNLLLVSGGKTFAGELSATTWIINKGQNNILEVNETTNTSVSPFDIAADFKTTLYDNSVYGFTNDSIYISKWGANWSKAPEKQLFNVNMKTSENQSIFVDKNNYIWVVGGANGANYDIWKGQLNRLRK